MAQKRITENPTLNDEIVLEFTTPDDSGCLIADPYKVDKIVIYFIERSFVDPTLNEYTEDIYNSEKLAATIAAEKLACDSPTEENIFNAKKLRTDLESSVKSQKFYYKDATPVYTVGTDTFPAWLSTDLGNALIEKVDEDEEGNTLYGNFKYVWKPFSFREGDYFVCYTWTSVIAGTSKSSHQKFSITSVNVEANAIPSHFTPPEKYPTLLERYTPEMFKARLSEFDRTPDVLKKLNLAIADGFTVLENYANQLIDLYDANVLTEPLLPFLSNLFNLRLKTNDPYRWRRQIKTAVPLFKKKGTIGGLKESLDQAGVKFIKLTRLWQVISNHTWQEVFIYDGQNDIFILDRTALPLDLDNFELYIRYADSESWVALSSDYIMFDEVDGLSVLRWIGDTLSVSPITLAEGDSVRVIYKVREVMTGTQQTIEDYIRMLPLMDSRDERDNQYPAKNWNVRLIEETDPLFDIIIPTKNPFHDDIIFGQVRTEFPYSENIYNMEEYNGSIRNSKDPCDIDKNFVDPCHSGLSSKYNIDLEIEYLSNDRIVEAHDVLRECLPFHAVLHVMNIYGGINETVTPPEEDYEILVTFLQNAFTISGNAQMWFNRVMMKGLSGPQAVLRDSLAASSVVDSGTGTAYNDSVVLFCGEANFKSIGMITDGTAILKILSGTLAGEYNVDNPTPKTVELLSITEPINETNNIFSSRLALNQRAFSFRLSNPIDASSTINIYQDNLFKFIDASQSFSEFKSLWDVSQGYSTASWKIKIPAYSATPFNIVNVQSDGSLSLEDNGSLPSSSASPLSYTAYDQYNNEIFSSSSGALTVTYRGRTEVLNTSLHDVKNVFVIGDYQKISGTEYKIVGFKDGTDDQFYIDGYNGGNVAGASLTTFRRLLDNQVGYLSHKGLKIQISGDLESSLSINNGVNGVVATPLEDDHFKENYIVEINGNLYFIAEIDGNNPVGNTTITLEGPDAYWKTISGGGTSTTYNIYRYTKTQGVTIPGQQFDLESATFDTIDRRGRVTVGNDASGNEELHMLQSPKDNFLESTGQKEGIEFIIEYSDGTRKKGDI